MKKSGFFEEEEGVKSSIRLQMFITMFYSFMVIGYMTVVNENHTPDFLTTITLLIASFAPKLLQNISESTNFKNIQNTPK